MELIVTVENHYGERRVYPECDKSRLLANIANKMTLTEANIELIKELGYTFKVKPEVI
tara:strand:+ start:364 stop:537 length:174 start_codon:yes stop_codon:yes gene_type:complete